jgi:hypothetical protein
LTLFLGWLIYLVWVNNVNLPAWVQKKSKEFLPIADREVSSSIRQQQTAKLADFIKEAQKLRQRLDEKPLPIRDHNEWVARVSKYLRGNLGSAYKVRFGDFSGMTFYSDGSGKSKMSQSIDGRSRRLHEFISELSR